MNHMTGILFIKSVYLKEGKVLANFTNLAVYCREIEATPARREKRVKSAKVRSL